MDKITPSNLRDEAQNLLAAGKMPALEELLEAVGKTREKYKPQIDDVREEKE